MKSMGDKELNMLLNNDREWRKFIIGEIRELRKEQSDLSTVVTTLKVKVGFFSGIFGAIAGFIASKL